MGIRGGKRRWVGPAVDICTRVAETVAGRIERPLKAAGEGRQHPHQWRLGATAAISVSAVVVAFAAWAAQPTPDASSSVADDPVHPPSARDARNPAAALRAAMDAVEADDLVLADSLFEDVARNHAVIADYADLLRARALVDQGATARAAVVCLQALQVHTDSPLRADFHQILGDTRALFEDPEAARSAWRAAIEETEDTDRQVALRMSLARSFEASGELQSAYDDYLAVWTGYASSTEAREAGERLDVLELTLAARRDGEDWRRRGDKLFRARHNEAALHAYDRALAAGLTGNAERRAQKQRAHTLFRMRKYPEAVKAFEALPQSDDDVRLWHARSLARSGRVDESIAEFEVLARTARGELRSRSRYLAALLLEGKDNGRDARSRRHFETVAANRTSVGLTNAALWRLGWSAYQREQYTAAVTYLDKLAKSDSDPIGRLRASYWRARSLEHLGKPEAGDELAQIAADYPFSYYGWRAANRVGAAAIPVVERKPLPAGRPRLPKGALARPRILLEAGLEAEALEELERSSRKARGLMERLEVASLFTDAGNFNRAQRIMVDGFTESLARGPVSGLEDVWWYAWPVAYGDLVDQATSGPDSVSRELVYSIMREESGYRPAVLSVSGARGLMQIMIPTGERLARDTGRIGFEPDDLFQPTTNIGLGSYYLGELSRQFPTKLSAAIASYNAGPSAVSGWVKKRAGQEDDEWVESIPYDQTRAYVKRVLRSLHVYQVLY